MPALQCRGCRPGPNSSEPAPTALTPGAKHAPSDPSQPASSASHGNPRRSTAECPWESRPARPAPAEPHRRATPALQPNLKSNPCATSEIESRDHSLLGGTTWKDVSSF